ncbi:MAG: hypothetical protein QXJ59_05265 [Thermofilaceae archaeon]
MRLITIIVNSVAAAILLLAAALIATRFWPASIIFILAAFDQVEDVYKAVYGKRLLPRWLAPVDIILELFLAALGFALAFFALLYAELFVAGFFLWALAALGLLISFSALSDVTEWFTARVSWYRRFVKRRGG